MWTVSLPVLFVNGSGADPALDGRDYAGWALWLVGFVLEVVADLVKMSFRQNVRIWEMSVGKGQRMLVPRKQRLRPAQSG